MSAFGFPSLKGFSYSYMYPVGVVVLLAFDRCCGLAVRILGFRSLSLPVPSPETYSFIGTSPSTSNRGFVLCSRTRDELDLRVSVRSQVHLDDDSVLSVVAYAVDVLKVKHGRFTLISWVRRKADGTSFFSRRSWTL